MVRTQIYITEDHQRALRTMAREAGKTQSETIRKAIDKFIERESKLDRLAKLRRARGIWKDREDVPALRVLRKEWDRLDTGEAVRMAPTATTEPLM